MTKRWSDFKLVNALGNEITQGPFWSMDFATRASVSNAPVKRLGATQTSQARDLFCTQAPKNTNLTQTPPPDPRLGQTHQKHIPHSPPRTLGWGKHIVQNRCRPRKDLQRASREKPLDIRCLPPPTAGPSPTKFRRSDLTTQKGPCEYALRAVAPNVPALASGFYLVVLLLPSPDPALTQP